MELLDEAEYQIGFTEDLAMRGLNKAAEFENYSFNYIDKANSGQFSQHQIILQSSMPL